MVGSFRALTVRKLAIAISVFVLLCLGAAAGAILLLWRGQVRARGFTLLVFGALGVALYLLFAFALRALGEAYELHAEGSGLTLYNRSRNTKSFYPQGDIQQLYIFNNSDYAKLCITLKAGTVRYYIGLTRLHGIGGTAPPEQRVIFDEAQLQALTAQMADAFDCRQENQADQMRIYYTKRPAEGNG